MRLTTSFVALALGASSPLLSGASPIPQDNSPANSPNPGHVSGTFDTGRFGGQAPDSSLGDFSSQDDNADPANEPKYQYNANVERGLNLGGLLGSSPPTTDGSTPPVLSGTADLDNLLGSDKTANTAEAELNLCSLLGTCNKVGGETTITKTIIKPTGIKKPTFKKPSSTYSKPKSTPKKTSSKPKPSSSKKKPAPKKSSSGNTNQKSTGGNGGYASSGNGGHADGGDANCSTSGSLIGINALNFNSCNGGNGGSASSGSALGGAGGQALSGLLKRDEEAHIANSDIKTNEVRRDTAATVEDTQGNDTASAQTNQLRRAAAADTSVPAEAGAPKEKQPKEPKTKGSKTKESETKEPKDIDEKKLKTRSVGGKGGAAKSGNGGEADGGNSNSSIKDSLIGVNALNFGSNNGGKGGSANAGSAKGGSGGSTQQSSHSSSKSTTVTTNKQGSQGDRHLIGLLRREDQTAQAPSEVSYKNEETSNGNSYTVSQKSRRESAVESQMPDSTPQGSVDSKHTQSQDSYSAAVEKRAQKGQAAEGKKGSTKDGKSTKSHAVELNYRRGEEENPSIDYQHTSQSDSAKVGRRDDAPRSQTTDSSSESSVPAQERPMEVQASRRGLSVSGDQDNTNVEATRPDDQQTDDAATGDDTTNEQGPADEQDAAPAEGEAASATRRSIKNDHGRVTIANAGNGGNAKSGNGGNASGGASNQRNAAVAQSKTNNQGGSKKSSPKKYYGGKQNYGSGSLIDLDLDLLCSSHYSKYHASAAGKKSGGGSGSFAKASPKSYGGNGGSANSGPATGGRGGDAIINQN